MEYSSRRERREAERRGLINSAANQALDEDAAEETDAPEQPRPESREARAFPSRRELREKLRSGEALENEFPKKEESPRAIDLSDHSSAPDEEATQNNEIAEQSEAEPLTGKSYLYQESSNTVTVDSIPDSLESTNGDLIVTTSESIEVITGSHPSITSAMDDFRYDSEDQKDTLAGRISLVDPVSAKLVAESREPEVIIPGKIVVRNRIMTTTFAIIGGVMFILAGIGLWWALSEIGPFSQ